MSAPKIHLDVAVPEKFLCLYDEKARYFVFHGGRGGAKSMSVAEFLVISAAAKPLTILCVREVQNSMKDSVHKLIADTIAHLGLKGFDVKEKSITHKNGSRFIFMGLQSHNADNVKSLHNADICWIEEGQCISRKAWDVLRPTLRKPGSYFIITMNPEDDTDAIYFDLILNEVDNAVVKQVNYYDNPYFPDELEQERLTCQKNNPDDYGWIWLGEIRKISDAQIFKGAYEIKEFETPANARFYHGADWGYANDPTAGTRMFAEDNCLYIDQEVYALGVELDDLGRFFNQIETMRAWPLYGDAARPDIISKLKRLGFNARKCKKWPGSVEAGIAYLRNFDMVYIHPRCVNTIEEFKRYSWKQDKHTGEILPVPIDKHNHCIDSIRYALSKQTRKQIEA